MVTRDARRDMINTDSIADRFVMKHDGPGHKTINCGTGKSCCGISMNAYRVMYRKCNCWHDECRLKDQWNESYKIYVCDICGSIKTNVSSGM